MNKKQVNESVFIIEDFLDASECQSFIDKSESLGFEEAKVGFENGAKLFKMTRNNDKVIFNDQALASLFFERAKEYLPESIDDYKLYGLSSNFRYYRYSPKQRFKMHKDGRQKINNLDVESRLSFLIYLNDDFEGGATKFKDFEVTPRQGSALVFIHELWHEGVVIDSGFKYVLRSDVLYSSVKHN